MKARPVDRYQPFHAVVALLFCVACTGQSSAPKDVKWPDEVRTAPDLHDALTSELVTDLAAPTPEVAPTDAIDTTDWSPVDPGPVANPVLDAPFWQEFNHTINEQPNGIGALVAVVTPSPPFSDDGAPVLVGPEGIFVLSNQGEAELLPLPEEAGAAQAAAAALDQILVATETALWVADASGVYQWVADLPGNLFRFLPGPEGPMVATSVGLFSYLNGELLPVLDTPVRAAASGYGSLIVATDAQLRLYANELIDGEPVATLPLDVGEPVAVLLDRTLPQSLPIVVIGQAGIAGFEWVGDTLAPADVPLFATHRLPLLSARRAVADPNGGFAVAAKGGAYRTIDGDYGPECRAYLPERWLPSADAVDLVMPTDAPGILYVATAKGLGWVTTSQWTFEAKAASMVETIVDHHDRDGAVADCRMTVPGDPSTCIPWDSDNDGGWTCYWVLGECFRHLVTGDPDARAHFDKSLDRMLSLRTLTGTDHFLARSVIRIEGCQLDDCDGPDDGEWFKSPDGEWWVKADTSNDEVTSHMFMMGWAHDLCADDDQKAAIVAHVDGIIGGLVDNDYKLIDPQDNKPTSHGHFGPDYCNDWVEGMLADGGRRSAQLLGAINLALYLTGKEKYRQAKASLIEEFHYDANIGNLGNIDVYPLCAGNGDCDELAMQAFVPLMRYEQDPTLRAQWVAAWDQLYTTLHTQEDAVWDLSTALFGGSNVDLARVSRYLRRYPVDLIRWVMHNDIRSDAVSAPEYYLNKDPDANYRLRSDGHTYPPDERPNERHNTTQFKFKGGHGWHVEIDSADMLFAYWMGRYYGFITTDAR